MAIHSQSNGGNVGTYLTLRRTIASKALDILLKKGEAKGVNLLLSLLMNVIADDFSE